MSTFSVILRRTALVLAALLAGGGLLFALVDAPVVPVAALVLALPIAVAGQRYATAAGGLMAALAGVPFVLLVIRMVEETTEAGESGIRGLLGGSSGAVVIPLAVLAALLLVAGVTGRGTPSDGAPQVEPTQPVEQL